jgi:hypothetical protein
MLLIGKCHHLPCTVSAFLLLLWTTSLASAQTSSQVHSVTIPQIKTIEEHKQARSLAQEKMSSQLVDAIAQAKSGHAVAGAPALRVPNLPSTPSGQIIIDIRGKVTSKLLGDIQDLGGNVISSASQFNSVRASLPLYNVESLASHSDVQFLQPAAQGQTNNIGIDVQGDIAHTANLVRAQLGVRGDGVKVGVLSDSIDDNFGSLQRAYDAGVINPGDLTILPGQQGSGAGEGLAMIEIIHTIAPGAKLFFATADGGPATMANNIIALRNLGCDVIVDDYTYFVESPFQEGTQSEAGYIDYAVRLVSNAGALYFSSARNSGNLIHGTSGTWEGDFHDGGPAGSHFVAAGNNARIHIFENGKTLNTVERTGDGDRLDLFWADPLAGSANGYDLFVVNSAGQVVRSSTTSQTGFQDPYQSIPTLHRGESVVIVKTATASPRFLHLDSGRAQLRYQTDGSVRGHNADAAANAFSVAATQVPTPTAPFAGGDTDGVEAFSSDGPRRIFFDENGTPLTPRNFSATGGVLIHKPDITAADGVSTSLPSGPLNPFFGTSAAAPHAAAIAALLLSCTPRPTPAEVRASFRTSARPIQGSGFNDTAGYGIVMARAAAGTWCKSAPHNVNSATNHN